MNKVYIIIIIIFILLITIGIISIGLYNKILFRKKKVEDKLNSIKQNLKDRNEIIRKLNTIFSNSSFHEDNLMLELNDLYIKINENSDTTLNLMNNTDRLLVKALSLDNLYPELNKNEEYNALKELFKDSQYKVMYGVETYNEEVEEYNKYRTKPIISIVNKVFKFPDYEIYRKEKDAV